MVRRQQDVNKTGFLSTKIKEVPESHCFTFVYSSTEPKTSYLCTMANDIDINVQGAISKLRGEFIEMTGANFRTAVARAINHSIAKARTQSTKAIRARYKVKSSDIKSRMHLKRAQKANLTATISLSMRPLPVHAFGARQTKKGVSVNVTGKRRVIRGAFIAKMASGHKGVWGRGYYASAKDFAWRKQASKQVDRKASKVSGKLSDLPIEEIVTASPYSMITHKTVADQVSRQLEQDFPGRLLHELKRIAPSD